MNRRNLDNSVAHGDGGDGNIWKLIEGLKGNDISVEDTLAHLEDEITHLTKHRQDVKKNNPILNRILNNQAGGSPVSKPNAWSDKESLGLIPKLRNPKRDDDDIHSGAEDVEDPRVLKKLYQTERKKRFQLEAEIRAHELHRRLSPRQQVSNRAYDILVKSFVGLCGHAAALAQAHKCLRQTLWQTVLIHAEPVRKINEELDDLVSYLNDALEESAIRGFKGDDGCETPGNAWWRAEKKDFGASPGSPSRPFGTGRGNMPSRAEQILQNGRPEDFIGGGRNREKGDPMWNWWYSDPLKLDQMIGKEKPELKKKPGKPHKGGSLNLSSSAAYSQYSVDTGSQSQYGQYGTGSQYGSYSGYDDDYGYSGYDDDYGYSGYGTGTGTGTGTTGSGSKKSGAKSKRKS